jgi:hypothetical protein
MTIIIIFDYVCKKRSLFLGNALNRKIDSLKDRIAVSLKKRNKMMERLLRCGKTEMYGFC